jgi:predicted dehydrogenase
MGKRRIRCLQALGIRDIDAFDIREDRRNETTQKYGVTALNKLPDAEQWNYDIAIISLPPQLHFQCMEMCIERKTHFFVEASVLDEGLAELGRKAKSLKVVAAPSATLLFHPAIQGIISAVKGGKIGSISHFMYQSGQYLPDWHPYEPVADYYVSNKQTGGAREIVPFEMTWLVQCFGWPREVFASVEKTIEIPGAPEIDDTYSLLMKFAGFSGSLVVDVVARAATRRMIINGSEGQIRWDWDDDHIKLFTTQAGKWENLSYEKGKSESGYNANISESMYVDEICEFIAATQGGEYRNNLADDAAVLSILFASETASAEGRKVCFPR